MDQNYVFMGFSVIFFTIVLASLLVIFYLFLTKEPHIKNHEDKSFAVIDIIELLKKVCPIGLKKKWKLLSLECGLARCWSRQLSLPILNVNLQLYGSAMVMNCSSLQLMHLIADVTKWSEWEPPNGSSKCRIEIFTDDKLRKDSFMCSDQIVYTISGSSTTAFRFLYLTKDDIGWVLLWNSEKLDLKFFLVQPCTTNNGSECCLVTHIVGSQEYTKERNIISTVAQRLRNMNDAIQMSSLSVMMFNFLSVSPFVCKENVDDNSALGSKPVPKIFKLSPTIVHSKKQVPQAFMLTPFTYESCFNIAYCKGFHLTVKKLENDSLFLRKMGKKLFLSNHPSPKRHTSGRSKDANTKDTSSSSALENVSRSSKATSDINASKFYISTDLNSASDLNSKTKENINDQTDSNSNHAGIGGNESSSNSQSTSNPSQVKSQIIKEETDSLTRIGEDFDGAKQSLSSPQNVKNKTTDFPKMTPRSFSEAILPTYNEIVEHFHDESVPDYACFQYNESYGSEEDLLKPSKLITDVRSAHFSDFEIILPEEAISDSKIADFVTQGNYCASELQAQLLQASSIELSSSTEEQMSSCGGWMHHSTHKGIPVLTKVSTNGFLRTTSFLCQTMISVPSKDIRKFVKNPRSRFICDETVKKVRILDQIPNGQKIIHTYHESSSLLRKEAVDFCLLQTEREEGNKFYSSFHSVEYENCPLMDLVTRGILLPSGWVVEELDNEPEKCNVALLIQILVNSPDSMLIQELNWLIPASLYNLKNYLTAKPL